MPKGSTLEQTTAVAREMAASLRTGARGARLRGVLPAPRRPSISTASVRRLRHAPRLPTSPISRSTCSRRTNAARKATILPGASAQNSPRSAARFDAAGRGCRGSARATGSCRHWVAEVYGPTEEARLKLATRVRRKSIAPPPASWTSTGTSKAPQPKNHFPRRQGQGRVCTASPKPPSPAPCRWPCRVPGHSAPRARRTRDVNIVLELPRALRARPDDLLSLPMRSETNPEEPLVPLRELVTIEQTKSEHKHLPQETCRMSPTSRLTWPA